MHAFSFTQPIRTLDLVAVALLAISGCKKEAAKDPLADCRAATSGTGIGIANARDVMFWVGQDFQCGPLQLISVRNTTLNTFNYGGTVNQAVTRYHATQPACGAAGTIYIEVSKGYVYEYVIACTTSTRQWKGTFTADCDNSCIAVQLK